MRSKRSPSLTRPQSPFIGRLFLLPMAAGRIWLIAFALWLLLLSGSFTRFFGSPGIVQAIRLKKTLDLKKQQLNAARQEVEKIRAESVALEKSRVAQLREIRRVLGYTSPDELVFDFSTPNQF